MAGDYLFSFSDVGFSSYIFGDFGKFFFLYAKKPV
jgi:hypothetical protein